MKTLSLPVKTVLIAPLAFMVGVFLADIAAAQTDAGPTTHIALASPDGVLPADDEPENGIGTSPSVAIDPVSDPTGAAKEISVAFSGGKYLLVGVLVLIALGRLTMMVADRWEVVWLAKSVPWIFGGLPPLVALAASLDSGAPMWSALLGAAGLVAAMFAKVPKPAEKVTA